MSRLLSGPGIYGLALLFIFLRALESIRSDDFFMCLNLGRLFFQGGLPDVDPFIFSITDFRWHVWHEWLAYVYYYGLYSFAGYHAVIVFKALWVTLMLGFILHSGRKSSATFAVAVMMMALYVASPRLFADRAAVFTDIFTLALFTAIYHENLFQRFKWCIPFLFIIWVQIHPGFVLGLILLGLKMLTSADRRQTGIVLAVSLAGVLLNPLGLNGALYPLKTVLSSEWDIYRSMNSEWVPTLGLSLLPVSYRILFAAFVFGSALLIIRQAWRARDFFAILSALLLASLGLSALRFVVISSLGLAILLAKAGPPQISFRGPRWPGIIRLVTAALLVAGIFWNFFASTHGPRILTVENPIHGSIPFKSARLFARLPPGPVWNDFDLGGLLLWETGGRMKIAAHGHIDRPALVVANYQRWSASESDFSDRIDGLHVEYFYLRRSSLLAERNNFWPKKLVTEWDLVYEDPQAVIFRRRTPKSIIRK